MISISRPTKNAYITCSRKKIPTNLTLDAIVNIKYLHTGINELTYPHKIICDKIINEMINIDSLKFLKFRDLLYDIFIYNLDITNCVWYILTNLTKTKKLQRKSMSEILLKTYGFLKYYNNNYRPIYHLESYLFYLIRVIHEYK